jgi:endonuclease YncB( thermonuclease family)
MLGWSKRPEASEIRAKFELRREQIRQRVLGAGRSASTRIHAARAATVAGIRAAGSAVRTGAQAGRGAASAGMRRARSGLAATGARFAGLGAAGGAVLTGVRSGVQSGGEAAASGARRLLSGLAATAAAAGEKARASTGAAASIFARPGVAGAVAAAGALALGAGIGRYRAAGLDGEVVAMLSIGGALAVTLLPAAWPVLAGLSPLATTAAAAVAMFGAAALWAAVRDMPDAKRVESKEVVGQATAMAGDVLKVAGTAVRLSGIEVPERAQLCGRDTARWRCSDAAQSALVKVVGGRPVRCRLSGTDKAGVPHGHCSIDRVDINAELVRQGYAFAEAGATSPYGAQEADARNAKAGMWVADALRPADFRAKAWEEAKRRAPDGCPIKGQVTGVDRVYVLPGTPSYDRLRMQTARGDRWFCSEQDAASAGFKAAQRG